jgi:hypothetical protein
MIEPQPPQDASQLPYADPPRLPYSDPQNPLYPMWWEGAHELFQHFGAVGEEFHPLLDDAVQKLATLRMLAVVIGRADRRLLSRHPARFWDYCGLIHVFCRDADALHDRVDALKLHGTLRRAADTCRSVATEILRRLPVLGHA